MAKFILARKGNMSRIFRTDGTVVPVTTLCSGLCVVTQVKTEAKDGYEAVQLGFARAKRASKPLYGQTKASGGPFQFIKEFRCPSADYKVGQKLEVSQFKPGDKVVVVGWSKGRGFQGVVKRHHFHGHPTSHGHKDQTRMPGSIGAGGVQHVRKGMRMAGRMGNQQVTVPNLEIVAVKPETQELLIKGAIPGAYRSLILISEQL